jgi:hypothetical protein
MTIELIGFVALVVAIVGIFSEPIFIIRAFLCSTLLGSAAASILAFLGNTSVTPAHLLLGFLTIKLLSDRRYRHPCYWSPYLIIGNWL